MVTTKTTTLSVKVLPFGNCWRALVYAGCKLVDNKVFLTETDAQNFARDRMKAG
jgi:hypothetical protein